MGSYYDEFGVYHHNGGVDYELVDEEQNYYRGSATKAGKRASVIAKRRKKNKVGRKQRKN